MARQRILVVSDDSETGEYIRAALVSAGYAVGLLAHAAVSKESLQVGLPDLVLLDMAMPNLDECSVLDQLWQCPVPPPVVALTGSYSSPLALALLARSVRGHFGKPLSVPRLLEVCARALESPGPAQGPSAEERRDEPRQRFIGEVTLLTHRHRPTLSGELVELSRSGARIDMGARLAGVFDKNRLVYLALHLPPKFEGVEISARIQWHEGAVLGVSFIDLDGKFQSWLDRWLRSHGGPEPTSSLGKATAGSRTH